MSELDKHIFLGLPAHKPRVWVDLDSSESKRAGLAMHRPGRKVLQIAMKVIGWFAWLPIEKVLNGPIKRFDELDGYALIAKMIDEPIAFITYYMGNDSAKSKYTILIRAKAGNRYIAKLGKTLEAGAAIRQEVDALKRLVGIKGISDRVPKVVGDVGVDGSWTWSVQTVLPKGESDVIFNGVHRRFLRVMQEATREGEKVLVHGDFAPWNMSVVNGRLYVYDWEDAHMGSPDEDERWFKKQVKELLGVDT